MQIATSLLALAAAQVLDAVAGVVRGDAVDPGGELGVAAELLDITRQGLHKKLKRYGLETKS